MLFFSFHRQMSLFNFRTIVKIDVDGGKAVSRAVSGVTSSTFLDLVAGLELSAASPSHPVPSLTLSNQIRHLNDRQRRVFVDRIGGPTTSPYIGHDGLAGCWNKNG